MKNLSIVFASIIVFLCACQKDEITVNLRTAGNLSVQVKDTTNKVYPNLKIHLLSSYYYNTSSGFSGSELDSKKTDTNGSVDFGTLEASNYLLVSDTIKIGNLYYLIVKPVQIVSADNKNLILNPLEYIGSLNLNLNIYQSGMTDTLTRTRLKVAIVRASDYNERLNRQAVLKKALFVKGFDSKGSVSIPNLPANITYKAYVYVNDKDTIGCWSNESYSISKDETESNTATVMLNELIVIKGPVSMTFTYYSSTTSSYKPVKNMNVILLYYDDYISYNLYSASLNVIKSYQKITGVTDANGKLSLSVPINTTFLALGYFDDTHKVWINTYIDISSTTTTNTFSFQVSGSSLGLTK